MSQLHVDKKLIEYISKNWDDRKNAQEVSDIIQAIVTELKKDYRKESRSYSFQQEDDIHYQGLIDEVQTKMFWDNMAHMLNFYFDFKY